MMLLFFGGGFGDSGTALNFGTTSVTFETRHKAGFEDAHSAEFEDKHRVEFDE